MNNTTQARVMEENWEEVFGKVLNNLKEIDIDIFVSGIRGEIGDTDELTQHLWYVWSPIGSGKTKDGEKRAYYGERGTCIYCACFTWDLSTAAPYPDIATMCSPCFCRLVKVRNQTYQVAAGGSRHICRA